MDTQTKIQPQQTEHTSKRAIKNIIGIMSGKGGVGKSLITSLLATTLNKKGYYVGIMDADITGPSIPKIFGIKGQPPSSTAGIEPARTKSGIKIISINMFLEDETRAIIWRGPMISNVIKQFWDDVFWGSLDYLFIDLPPGTSDVPLTVIQSIPLKGMIIVSTPQDLVSMIVEKAINMTTVTNTPIIGLIENMSYLNCPNCNKKIEVFGESKGEKIAIDKNIKFLGSLPIDKKISTLCDNGKIEEYTNNVILDIVNNIVNNLISETLNIRNISKEKKEDNMKRIAIPTEGNSVSSHFGHCEKFVLIDIDAGKIVNKNEIPAPDHQPGFLPTFLSQQGVNVILAGGIGQRAKDLFEENNIEVFAGVEGLIDDVINSYINGNLKSTNSFCSGHRAGSCNHSCNH